MLLKPSSNSKPESLSSQSQSNVHYFGQLHQGSNPGNDWPVIEILSQGLSERDVTRLNGEIESNVKYNRAYFSVPRGASSADEVFRLPTRAFTPEMWGALESIQSNIIPHRGSPPGFDVIVACLLEGGAPLVTAHHDTIALAELRTEFNRSQSRMDTDDLDTIRDILNKDMIIAKGIEKSKKRIPAKVWDDTGIATLGPATGYPAYYLATIAIMAVLVDQPSVNPGHASKMDIRVRKHFKRVSSKYRMSKACLVAAEKLEWGPV